MHSCLYTVCIDFSYTLYSRYEALKDSLCVASSLDPRFKTLPFLSDEARDAVFFKLTSEAAHLNQSADVSLLKYVLAH